MIESSNCSNWPEDESDVIPAYSFYNNTVELFFDPGPHVYYRYDEEYNRVVVPGVTTVLNVINKDYLKAWAAKLAVEYVREQLLLPDGTLKQLSTEDFHAMLQEAKSQHKVRLDIAGDIGHLAHDCLEQSIKNAVFKNKGVVSEIVNLPLNPLAASCVQAAFAWMQAHNVRWESTESKVYSKKYDVAGTTDGMGLVDSCTDLMCCRGREFKNHRSCIDWKSSNQIDSSYAYQTALYVYAQLEENGGVIDSRFILRLGKVDGKFEPWFIPNDYLEQDVNAFLAALNLYRSLEEITQRRKEEDNHLREIAKSIKVAQKAAVVAQERLEKRQAREVSKQETKARLEAAKAKYKQLREDGISVAEAKRMMKEG